MRLNYSILGFTPKYKTSPETKRFSFEIQLHQVMIPDCFKHSETPNINILTNTKLSTVPESVIILREQFLCRSWGGGSSMINTERINNSHFILVQTTEISVPLKHYVRSTGWPLAFLKNLQIVPFTAH